MNQTLHTEKSQKIKKYMFHDGDIGECEVRDVINGDFQSAAEEWYKDIPTVDETSWYDYNVYEMDAIGEDGFIDYDNFEAIESGTVTLYPPEPECDDSRGHNWDAIHDIEGGLEENPGVWGHGGGVIIVEHCTRCNVIKTKDTWAQRSDTGEQGLVSISYDTGDHSEEVDDE